MRQGSNGAAKPSILLGGTYNQHYLNLFEELSFSYAVHSFDAGSLKSSCRFDYAVIDNKVLEESESQLIPKLINANSSIKIILREVPYTNWEPKTYTAHGLAQLQAAHPLNVIFPQRSYVNDVVVAVLEELVQT